MRPVCGARAARRSVSALGTAVYRRGTRPAARAIPPLLLALLALAGCEKSEPRTDERVLDYCRYGSGSRAEFKACTEHVRPEDVRRRDSNAARYAKEELNVCLGDAGPFCQPRRGSLLSP